jgi:hypothetical protein
MFERIAVAFLLVIAWTADASAQGAVPRGTVTTVELRSRALADNLLGIDAARSIRVYLPPGYESGKQRYPVIYYFHNPYWSARQLFEENHLGEYIDRAIAQGVLGKVIVVAGDFTTPNRYNFFSNTRVAGRWIDHIVDELMPMVDARYRTLATPASRGLAGDFFGGYAAFKLAMLHGEKFGALYALHPVGTGNGVIPFDRIVDWNRLLTARTPADLSGEAYAPVFLAMAQAYLPNEDRPPFFCDFLVDKQGENLVVNAANLSRLREGFALDELLPLHVAKLRGLRAIKFDWGRYDTTYSHVYANQAFTRKLHDFGVPHVAEEHGGNAHDQLWVEQGRIEADLLPFFANYLEGAAPRS